MAKATDEALKTRVSDLRHALKLTQKQMAERAELPDDSYIARVEIGKNKLGSYAMRVAFARGFGLTLDDLDAYLDGKLSVEQARRRSSVTVRAAS